MKSLLKYLCIILILPFFNSCSKDESGLPDTVNLLKLGSEVTSASTFKIELFATDTLFVGYNKVYFKVINQNSGQAIGQADIIIHPLMDMITSSHACPVENPENSINSDGYFQGAVLFSMMGTNSWTITVDITAESKTESAIFHIEKVKSTNPVKKIVVIDSLNTGPGIWTITKYPVTLVEPSTWKVGNNPFEITVHKMASMMSFPCCTDVSVEITPEMPSMGHGSPNNINPVSLGNGHYLGSVNFTMTGAWRINMIFKRGDRILNNKVYFDVVF